VDFICFMQMVAISDEVASLLPSVVEARDELEERLHSRRLTRGVPLVRYIDWKAIVEAWDSVWDGVPRSCISKTKSPAEVRKLIFWTKVRYSKVLALLSHACKAVGLCDRRRALVEAWDKVDVLVCGLAQWYVCSLSD